MADDNNNVANYTRQANPFQNDKVYRGTTEYLKDAILRVFGDPALGEPDYEARWAEFVNGVFRGGSKIKTIDAAEYPVTRADYMLLADATSSDININLPPAADFYDAVNDIGYSLIVKKIDVSANTVTIVPDDVSELLDNLTSKVITAQFTAWEVISDGTQWWFRP